jgi:hypothetical protein
MSAVEKFAQASWSAQSVILRCQWLRSMGAPDVDDYPPHGRSKAV